MTAKCVCNYSCRMSKVGMDAKGPWSDLAGKLPEQLLWWLISSRTLLHSHAHQHTCTQSCV